MKTRLVLLLAGCLGTSLCSVIAQPIRLEQAAPAPGPGLVTPLPDRTGPSPAGQAQSSGNIVAEVQRMIEAHADANVIKAFIQNWPGPFAISADEILHLHDIGASTDLLTTLIHRSAELQARASSNQAPAPNAAEASSNAPAQGYPEMATAPPAYFYPYPSTAYTYSSLYPYSVSVLPDYTYRYWSAPYYSFYYGYWPYRSYYWGRRPWYGYGYGRGYYPGHYYGWRSGPGYYGHGGSGFNGGYSRGGFGGHGRR